jgi:hypothetical protein
VLKRASPDMIHLWREIKMGNPRPAGGNRVSISRISGTGTSVGSSFVEVQLTVPARGLIRRVRADVTAGTAISQLALEVREITGGTTLDIVAAYPLQAEPLDDDMAAAPLFYNVAQTGSLFGGRSGVLFVAVKVDDATADHTIVIYMDVEAVE